MFLGRDGLPVIDGGEEEVQMVHEDAWLSIPRSAREPSQGQLGQEARQEGEGGPRSLLGQPVPVPAQEAEEKTQKLFLLTQEKPINIPTERIYEMATERGWKEYAVLHKIAEHIANYQRKYSNIVTNEYSDSLAILELEKWCKKYGKKNNKWHKDFVISILDEKRK